MPFPPPAQTCEVLRSWDRRAMEDFGIPGIVLMENAGAEAARLIHGLALAEPKRYGGGPFRVLCGPGNNGGDGFVVARHLASKGLDVSIWVLGGNYAAESDAGINLEIVKRMQIPLVTREGNAPIHQEELKAFITSSGTLVDALFGTGLSRPLRPPFLECVEAINSSGRPVIALDIPSGLDGDSGKVLGGAVQASHTITFAATKTGFSREQGARCCGAVHVVDIGIPREIWCT